MTPAEKEIVGRLLIAIDAKMTAMRDCTFFEVGKIARLMNASVELDEAIAQAREAMEIKSEPDFAPSAWRPMDGTGEMSRITLYHHIDLRDVKTGVTWTVPTDGFPPQFDRSGKEWRPAAQKST